MTTDLTNVGFSGFLRPENHTRIVELLTELCAGINKDTDIPPSVEYIQKTLEQCDDATVTHRVTGDEVHRPDRRMCKRLTFNQKSFVSELSEEVKSALYHCTPVNTVQVELSHGDILLYQKGDYFDWHRDTVPKAPDNVPSKAKYYTMLLGLIHTDSGGHTSVRDSDTGYVHTFDQACDTGGFVLFRSDAYHRGGTVLNGCKMVLKLDFWCTVGTEHYECTCIPCQTYDYDTYEPDDRDDDWCNGYHE